MAENRKLKVFLCHSKDDKPKVRELHHRLVADGFDAWFDEEKLMPGQDWDLEIRKAVRETDVVIVCLSSSSVTKAGYIQKEIRFALDVADEQPEGAIYLIPARFEDCRVPLHLGRWQWVNLFEEKGYQQLSSSLKLQAEGKGLTFYLPFDFEPQMVYVPAGRFTMGSTSEQNHIAHKNGVDSSTLWLESPAHLVDLSEYYIGRYPITNHEYQIFVVDAYKPPFGWDDENFFTEKGDHPVVHVSWEDADLYCKWLSKKSGKIYRLPTEAEWEKAARGENGFVYPWGDEFDAKKANTIETKILNTTRVGRFSPQGDSPYGCSDMCGNVWEWCNDFFDENDEYRRRQNYITRDPKGPKNGIYRVMRGGSYVTPYWSARCATREQRDVSFNTNLDVGFRVAFSPSIGKQ